MTPRLPTLDRPSFDRSAAAGATVAAVATVVLLVAAQTAVVVVATDGHQAMGRVEEVPTDPSAGTWAAAPNHTLTLKAQTMAVPEGGGSVGQAEVRSVTNETHVAVRVHWPDATNDSTMTGPGSFSDAAAVMLHTGSTPPITMGAAGDPVNIWYWRSAWQYGDAQRTGDMYAYPHGDEVTRPGVRAGNPVSTGGDANLGQNYYAKNFGSLTYAPDQSVAAQGERTEDGWTVVFVRERETDGRFDATFNDSAPTYLTVAVWNGSQAEVNGMKSLSYTFLAVDGGDGSLSVASGGQRADGGGADTATGADGGAGSQPLWFVGSFTNMLATLFVVMVVTWTVAYRRLRRGED